MMFMFLFTAVEVSFVQEQYVLREGVIVPTPISVLISPGPGVNASGNLTLAVDPVSDQQCTQACAVIPASVLICVCDQDALYICIEFRINRYSS